MGDERGDTQAGTRLLVRAHPWDLGSRPVSPSWQSPDIYQQGGSPIGEVTEGVAVPLAAMVTNVGSQAALGVHVDFYWADSSLGISKASATPIGSSTVASVSAGASVEFLCPVPWIPSALGTGAHPCLVVEAAGVNCPVQNSFRPDLDSQVGQRNVTIKAASGLRRLVFQAFNPFAEEAGVVLAAQSVRLDGDQVRGLDPDLLLHAGLGTIDHLLHEQHIRFEPMNARDALRLAHVGEPQRPERRGAGETSAAKDGFRTGREGMEPLGELSLPGGASADVHIDAELEGAGTVSVHRIVAIVGGYEVGGYTIVAL